MTKFIVNSEDLVPYEPAPAPKPPVPIGINAARWNDWTALSPWTDRTICAREPDAEGRTWLMTYRDMAAPGSHINWTAEVEGNVEWLNATAMKRDDGLFDIIAMPDRNVGFRGTGRVRWMRPDKLPHSTYDPTWVRFAKQFEYVRFMPGLRMNQAEAPAVEEYLRVAGLCRDLGIRPWLNIHHLHMQDERVLDQINFAFSGLDPIIEGSNEVWNWIFPCAQYFADNGPSMDADRNRRKLENYARAHDVMVEALDIGDMTVVLGSQWTNPWVTRTLLDHRPDYDHVAVAPYFGHWVGRDREVAMGPWDVIVDLCKLDIGKTVSLLAEHSAASGKSLWAYEGGSHVTPHGKLTGDMAVRQKLSQFNRSPQMRALMVRHLNEWFDSGGGKYSAFVMNSDAMGRSGDWGIMNNPSKSEPILERLNASHAV